MRDAFKPAIKRLRDGCDIARRVEESMVASAALGRAAILEEQSNLIQVRMRSRARSLCFTVFVVKRPTFSSHFGFLQTERLHAHTRAEMVTLHCLAGEGAAVKVKMPPVRLLDLFSNRELYEVACHSRLRIGTNAPAISVHDDASKARKMQLERACEREYAALRLPPLPPSCPGKSWEEKNIQRVADAVVLRKAASSLLAHAIAHTSIRPTHPAKKIGSPRLVPMPPPSGPPSPRLGSSSLPTGMPPPLLPKV
jgi:hypothetical protein